jgi:hypothetical protein
MWWTIFVLLTALWLMGMLSSYTLGGLLHLLLAVSLLAVIVRLVQGRKIAG